MSKLKIVQPKPSNRVELKYCESCGCLLTRTVGSCLTFCALCESKYSEEERYLTHPKKRAFTPSPRSARLPVKVDLQACADTTCVDSTIYPEFEECA